MVNFIYHKKMQLSRVYGFPRLNNQFLLSGCSERPVRSVERRYLQKEDCTSRTFQEPHSPLHDPPHLYLC